MPLMQIKKFHELENYHMMLGKGINKESFVSKVFIAPSNRSPFRKIYMYHIIEEEKQIKHFTGWKIVEQNPRMLNLSVNTGQ